MPVDPIELLLILGAGASREFGANREPMPLMADFSDAIIAKLYSKPGFQDATGLIPD